MPYEHDVYKVLTFSELADGDGQEGLSLPDLMRMIPEYYRNSRVMKAIQSVDAAELGQLRFALDETLEQFFVDSATWGLDGWEKELGLSTDSTSPTARRRELIRAKLRGTGTTTKRMIIEAAASFSGGEVEVTEYPEESRFEVKFVGVKGIPSNMPGFIRMLEDIKPAHLAYSFAYTYTTWSNLLSLHWSDAGAKTWNELRIYEGG
ncbi:YmfQ family protein [Paenibacillus sp. GCM10012303]|uniref:YmfQ family protein n=1 Tax=Paenibacillus sp. GCM10012303 TaxID=3317340 RepID=UPI0036094DF2